MSRSIRRIDFATSWAATKQAFAALLAEREALKRALELVRHERDDYAKVTRALQAATLARMKAEAELASFYRERMLKRARAAERDPAAPLQ